MELLRWKDELKSSFHSVNVDTYETRVDIERAE